MVRKTKIIFKNQFSHISDMLDCWGQSTSEKVSNALCRHRISSIKTEKEDKEDKGNFLLL